MNRRCHEPDCHSIFGIHAYLFMKCGDKFCTGRFIIHIANQIVYVCRHVMLIRTYHSMDLGQYLRYLFNQTVDRFPQVTDDVTRAHMVRRNSTMFDFYLLSVVQRKLGLPVFF